MISVGFLTASSVFVSSEMNALAKETIASISSADVFVDQIGSNDRQLIDAVRAVPGVDYVEASQRLYTEFSSAAGPGLLDLASLPLDDRLRWQKLDSGTWPVQADQIAVGVRTAKTHQLTLGSTMKVTTGDEQRTLTVTGLIDQNRSVLSDTLDSAYASTQFFDALPYDSPFALLVLAKAGTDPATLVAPIAKVVPAQAEVASTAELADDAVRDLVRGADLFTIMLSVFGAIALLVGSLIIINTFTILIAQRRRQIGLLRAVGAETGQVRRQLLTEALVVGIVGAISGVLVGIGLAAIGQVITGSIAYGVSIPWARVGAAALLGVVVTVIAGLVPAARATKIKPLEALRPVADETAQKRTGIIRVIIASTLLIMGSALVVGALATDLAPLIMAIAGSAVLAVGILALAPIFLPGVLKLFGAISSRCGTTARIAAANTIRNPGRAAATCTALMLGVGLIVTLQVGAGSVRSTMNSALSSEFPVDVTITNPDGPLSPAVLESVRGVDQIAAVTAVRGIMINNGDMTLAVSGLDADAGSVIRKGFEALKPGTALVHRYTLEALSLSSGDKLTLKYGSHKVDVTVLRSDVASEMGQIVVLQSTLAVLAPNAPVNAVWAAATDRNAAGAAMSEILKVTGKQENLVIGGSLQNAAQYQSVLDILLNIATGLLGVAVLIALIGVSNTLGLSVIERSRESALLRALGLQRRQLRLMLVIEAILLALVGAFVGIIAGIGFGVIGTAAIIAETGLGKLEISVSVAQTAAVVAIAVIAGAIASILPGRRAALASPTEALAEV